jgi:hypothetical protein
LVRDDNNFNHIRDAENAIVLANKDDLYNCPTQELVFTENHTQSDKDSTNISILERVSLSDTMLMEESYRTDGLISYGCSDIMDNEEIEIIFTKCDDMEVSDQYELSTVVSTDTVSDK